jgi:hypothetical protein
VIAVVATGTRSKDKTMKSKLFLAALAACAAASPAAAQEMGGRHGGWMQRDMTRQQAQQMADTLFQRLDLNHDGIVTRQEAQQAAAQFGGGGDQAGDRAGRMINRIFGDAQSVTQAQAEAQSLARFDAMDLNHDGTVTAAERDQARAQRGKNSPQ